jgi:hypothetical protein
MREGVENGPLVAAVPHASSYPIKIINELLWTKTDKKKNLIILIQTQQIVT